MRTAYIKEMSISSLNIRDLHARSLSPEAVAWREVIEQDGSYPPPLYSQSDGELVFGFNTVAALYLMGRRKVSVEIYYSDGRVSSDPGYHSRKIDRSVVAMESDAPISLVVPVSGSRNDLETFGLAIDELWEAKVAVIRKFHEMTILSLKKAVGQIATAHRTGYPTPDTSGVEGLIRLAWQTLSRGTPQSLCPYCKGLPYLCGPCDSRRWVGTLEDVPDELLDDEDKRVMLGDGRIVTYSYAKELCACD